MREKEGESEDEEECHGSRGKISTGAGVESEKE